MVIIYRAHKFTTLDDRPLHSMVIGEWALASLSVPMDIVCVRAAKRGKALGITVALPAGHIGFYKGTVVRLVHADELPSDAIDYFDKALVVERYSVPNVSHFAPSRRHRQPHQSSK